MCLVSERFNQQCRGYHGGECGCGSPRAVISKGSGLNGLSHVGGGVPAG
jgi:hypothetical protein